MKTAISLPDEVFESAERLAQRLGKSRSRLYSDAVAAYVARHADGGVTEELNAVVDALDDAEASPWSQAAGRRVLVSTEW